MGVGLALGMLAASGGCKKNTASSVGVVREGEVDSDVFVGNRSFYRKLKVVDLGHRRANNDLLECWAELENRKKSTLQFQYMLEWYDRDDFKIDSPTMLWHPALVHGRDRFKITGVAPDARAVKFRIRVRTPDEVR
jgi:hypothetical protein